MDPYTSACSRNRCTFLFLKHKVWILATSVDNHLKRAELSDLILGRTFFEVETDNNVERIEVSSNSLTSSQGSNRLTFWAPTISPFLLILIKPMLLQWNRRLILHEVNIFLYSRLTCLWYMHSSHACPCLRCLGVWRILPISDCQPL